MKTLLGTARLFLAVVFFVVPSIVRAQTINNFHTLSEGSRGKQVVELQQELQQKGYFPTTVEVTGYFGKITKSAVMAFQKAKNLNMFGIFGPLTKIALRQEAQAATTDNAKTALPLYIYPSANEPNWTAAIKAGGANIDFIVANISNGPGTSVKTDWKTMISKAVAAGIKVYGYVDTSYTTKSGATVDSQVTAWFKLYPQVTGIFFDRVSSEATQLTYYKARYDYVKSKSSKYKVVISPGTITDERYMTVSDVNIIFESFYSGWFTKTMPAWVANYPKERFFTIVYDVSSEAKMKEVVRVAKARNFGRIFVTNASGLSSALPPYFQAELAEITAPPVIAAQADGVCGSANNLSFATSPTYNLCSVGVAGVVSGFGPWVWNCSGVNGGATTDCGSQKTILPTKTALPLYIYPSASEPNWLGAINAGGSKVDFIVANVDSGPGVSAEPTWTNMINKAAAAGIKVYGYVDTNYATKSGSTVESQAALWFQFYPQVTGIFFDRVSSGATQLPYYQSRYNYVKNLNSNFKVVINPGTITDEGYMMVSDVNIIFENLYSSWLNKTMPAWVANYPKERFYAIVYDVPTEVAMKDVVRTAKSRNFGRIFATNATTLSASLPSYFQIELTEIISAPVVASSSINAVCGLANGVTLYTTPVTNLCSSGVASLVVGSGPWTWTCVGTNGDTAVSCGAQKITPPTPVNGVCGLANNTVVSTPPTTNLCYYGTASAAVGAGPWTWNCAGLYGGTTGSCSAQKISASPAPISSRTFTEDTALNVRNPERGLYYPINLFSNTLANCQSAVRKGYTIVYTEAILPKNADLRLGVSDSDQPLSGDFIGKIRDGLAAVRSCGAKAIVRFYYLKGGSGSDPALNIITGHIAQIKSVLAENSDVVVVFQAGFAGYWGEWHGSSRAESATDRATILNAFLDAVPANRMVQVRTPGKRQEVFSGTKTVSSANAIGGTASDAPTPFSGAKAARTGHFDDCFMGTLRNYGTYSTFGSSAYNEEVAYVAQNSRFTPMGGESCVFAKRNAATMVYTYDPTETYQYTNLAHIRARAKKEMATMHWSFLNGTYSEEVRDSVGGNAGLALIDSNANPLSNDNSSARTVADHNCPDGIFDSAACIYEGFYPEMLKRLGYRLVLLNSSFSSQVRSEGSMQIGFALRNIGFAAMFNTRPVYLVLHNGTNRYDIPLTGVDPRAWESKSDSNGAAIVDSSSIINVSYTVNRLPTMTAGTYSVSLWMPDEAVSLQSRPQYSVRFANTNMWNAALGLNLLAANAVVVLP